MATNNSTFELVGQVGTIKKLKNGFLINIAENKFKPNKKNKTAKWEKDYTIWFNCVCDFEPNAKTGDTVLARGIFLPSQNDNYPYLLKIKHLGKIKDSNNKESLENKEKENNVVKEKENKIIKND